MTPIGLMFAAGLALGQTPADPAGTPARDDRTVSVAVAGERAEDVEVMRRILNRAVGLPNEPTSQTANMLNSVHQGVAGYPAYEASLLQQFGTTYAANTPAQVRLADPFDGVYLKGHGVVYTLKVKAGEQYSVAETRRTAGLSAGCTLCHVSVPVPASRLEPQARSQAEPTEWDRTRDDLRGVREPAPAQPAPTVDPQAVCRPGRLTETLIAALARNGRHIRHLPAAEGVTVVVTLDGLYGPARVAATYFEQAFLNSTEYAAPDPAAPGASPELKPSGFTEEETKQITLGDLHMKQGNSKAAVDAYHKALERVGLVGAVKLPIAKLEYYRRRFPAILQEMMRSTAEVRRKLAYALLAAGDAAAAKKVLDASFDVTVEADAGRGQPAPVKAATAPAVSVPAKLVLSVKKADLDRADKLSPAEFRQLVTIETVGLPPADKKK